MKKVRQLPAEFMREGLTAEKLSCAMALGLTIGMFPCPWGATVLCAFLAFLLGINPVAIQIANYLAWPLQIILFIPFFQAGQKLFSFGQPFSVENLAFSSFHQQFDSLKLFLVADIKALMVWLLVSPLIYFSIYFLAMPVFLHFKKNTWQQQPRTPDNCP